jgi:hypothetical protein
MISLAPLVELDPKSHAGRGDTEGSPSGAPGASTTKSQHKGLHQEDNLLGAQGASDTKSPKKEVQHSDTYDKDYTFTKLFIVANVAIKAYQGNPMTRIALEGIRDEVEREWIDSLHGDTHRLSILECTSETELELRSLWNTMERAQKLRADRLQSALSPTQTKDAHDQSTHEEKEEALKDRLNVHDVASYFAKDSETTSAKRNFINVDSLRTPIEGTDMMDDYPQDAERPKRPFQQMWNTRGSERLPKSRKQKNR